MTPLATVDPDAMGPDATDPGTGRVAMGRLGRSSGRAGRVGPRIDSARPARAPTVVVPAVRAMRGANRASAPIAVGSGPTAAGSGRSEAGSGRSVVVRGPDREIDSDRVRGHGLGRTDHPTAATTVRSTTRGDPTTVPPASGGDTATDRDPGHAPAAARTSA